MGLKFTDSNNQGLHICTLISYLVSHIHKAIGVIVIHILLVLCEL